MRRVRRFSPRWHTGGMSERKSMQRVREILRLRAQGQELRPIGLSVGASPSTVHAYLERAERAQVTWGAAQTMSDSDLRRALFPSGRGGEGGGLGRAPFDCGHIHVELAKAVVSGGLRLTAATFTSSCGDRE